MSDNFHSDDVIRVVDLHKRYRIGAIGTGTLSRDLHRAYARWRGAADPYTLVTGGSHGHQSQHHDALSGVTFGVRRGEVLGIIGRNGAGKSTLLKLLSRITSPSSGKIFASGKVASLLEVGTGFHPELTGRENVFLNGAIMGMNRSVVRQRMEQIIDFSGCREFIDTPVKRYSSGMTVRLGFAVAAHLDCDILIVDEVLAVGDREFQRKCVNKLQQTSADDERTVLFVTHNLSLMQSLCDRCLVVDQGRIVASGSPSEAIHYYNSITDEAWREHQKLQTRLIETAELHLATTDGQSSQEQHPSSIEIPFGDTLEIAMTFRTSMIGVGIIAAIYDDQHQLICDFDGRRHAVSRPVRRVCCRLKSLLLLPGDYYINLYVAGQTEAETEHVPNAIKFKVLPSKVDDNLIDEEARGVVHFPHSWVYQ